MKHGILKLDKFSRIKSFTFCFGFGVVVSPKSRRVQVLMQGKELASFEAAKATRR